MLKEFDYLKYRNKNLPLFPLEPFVPAEPEKKFDFIVVIPALNENASLPKTLESLRRAGEYSRAMIIAVVNNAPDAPEEWQNANAALLASLRKNQDNQLFWVDCATSGLSGGVGAARKVGMDLAVQLFPFATSRDKTIFSLDADTLVSENYFTATAEFLRQNPACEAAVFTLDHQKAETSSLEQAIRQYQNYLYSYAESLRNAGSPYGFVAVGSAFAVRLSAYVSSGGMRIRPAGEDFYFLQAVRKFGLVGNCAQVQVAPEARVSSRTPFGTGNTLYQYINGVAIRSHRPESFAELARLLAALPKLDENIDCFMAALSPQGRLFLTESGFPAVWEKIATKGKKGDPFAFHRYFDGLKTIQFIKFCDRNFC